MNGCKNLLLESKFKDPKKEAAAAVRSLNGHPGTWEQTLRNSGRKNISIKSFRSVFCFFL